MRDTTDRLGALYSALADAPYKHDFYHAMRMIEALNPQQPRFGQSLRPSEDCIRLRQEPSMTFAPAAVSKFELSDDRALNKPALSVRFFGFLGPNGPMPLHLTEFAVQRIRHNSDPTLSRFMDVLHHRWLSLFYRIWAQASPTASLDRPYADKFSFYVNSIIGYGGEALQQRSSVPDMARQFFAGILGRQVRNADGIASILQQFFSVPVQIEHFVGHWMRLSKQDQTQLGGKSSASQLGLGATLGSSVWDRQHKICAVLGPMSFKQYQDLLPTGTAGARLRDWLLSYFGYDLSCDVRLVLERDQVPRASLGGRTQLGWTSWAGSRAGATHAEDLVLSAVNLSAA